MTVHTLPIDAALGVRKGGIELEMIGRSHISGDEEELVEERIEALTALGRHIVDYNLTIDAASEPPVTGWILHREATSE